MRKQIYEYRVIGHANKGSKKNPIWESEIIDEGEILATDLKEAEFFVHREIDSDDIELYGLENIEIVIRSFVNKSYSTWPPSTISYGSTTGAIWNPSAPSYHTGPQFTTTGVTDAISFTCGTAKI
jgi:hypothetical protein